MRRWLVLAVTGALVSGAVAFAGACFATGRPAVAVRGLGRAAGPNYGGTRITVLGRGFSQGATVRFGRIAGRGVLVISPHRLTVITPAHRPGTVDVRVRAAAGVSAAVPADRFTFGYAPYFRWTARTADTSSGDVTAVSCAPDDSICAVGDRHGGAGIFRGPDRAPVPVTAGGAPVTAMSCSAGAACHLIDSNGRVYFTDGSSWGATVVQPALSGVPTGMSCSNASTCTVVDDHGWAATLSNGAWTTAEQIDPGHTLTALSCPDSSTCVAVDDAGRAFTDDAGQWSPAEPVLPDTAGSRRFTTLSCPQADHCVAAAGDGTIWTRVGGTWATTAQTTIPGLTDLSCGSNIACDAVADGWVWKYDGTWRRYGALLPLHPTLVSCDASECAAIATRSGELVDDSTRALKLHDGGPVDPPSHLSTVACVSAGRCMLADTAGRSIVLANVHMGMPTPVDVRPLPIVRLACPTRRFCAAAEGDGPLDLWNGHGWTAQPTTGVWTGLDCATPLFCAAAGPGGFNAVLSSGAWHHSPSDVPSSRWEPSSGACPRDGHCFFSDIDGVMTYAAGRWAYHPAPALEHMWEQGFACASLSFCVQTGTDRRHPRVGRSAFWDGHQWTARPLPRGFQPRSVSCASPSFCLAVGAHGQAARYISGTWQRETLPAPDTQLSDVSCPTTTFCAVIDSDNNIVLTATR